MKKYKKPKKKTSKFDWTPDNNKIEKIPRFLE